MLSIDDAGMYNMKQIYRNQTVNKTRSFFRQCMLSLPPQALLIKTLLE